MNYLHSFGIQILSVRTTATIVACIEINVKRWIHSVTRSIFKSLFSVRYLTACLCSFLSLYFPSHRCICVCLNQSLFFVPQIFWKFDKYSFSQCWCCKLRWWHFTYPTTATTLFMRESQLSRTKRERRKGDKERERESYGKASMI